MSELLELIKQQEPTFLKKAKHGGYICPVCGNGTGANATGITRTRGKTDFYCPRPECRHYYDVLTLYALDRGIISHKEELRGDTFTKALEECSSFYGFNMDLNEKAAEPKKTPEKDTQAQIRQNKELIKVYIEKCAERLKASEMGLKYLLNRGLTIETVERFKLGFDDHKSKFDSCNEPCIVIPYNPSYSYYTKRLLEPKSKAKYIKGYKDQLGAEPLFNAGAISKDSDKPIFIVEGLFCAISLLQVTNEATAVALNTAAVTEEFKRQVNKNTVGQNRRFILCLDNDEPGQKATEQFEEYFKSLNIKYIVYQVQDECKDINELLQKDAERLTRNVEKAIYKMDHLERAAAEEYKDKYNANRNLQEFLDNIQANNIKPISTGLETLDKTLDGGLYEGLYIMGAISSLGKTTLALQIMDNIASQGRDVLIFSLEMSKGQLFSKSISRESAKYCISHDIDISKAKTVKGVTRAENWAYYTDTDRDIIKQSILAYEEISKHVYIVEGESGLTAEGIAEAVKNHISFNGSVPVVLVDYLQIMEAISERDTDKRAVDRNIKILKHISRTHKTPVFCISSLNRDNYDKRINKGCFKESGGIEYGADVIIGLQIKGQGETTTDSKGKTVTTVIDTENELKKEPREIEAFILKNREGRTGDIIEFSYSAKYNLFLDQGYKDNGGGVNFF